MKRFVNLRQPSPEYHRRLLLDFAWQSDSPTEFSLIVQNGNAYDEGLREFWDPIKAYWKDKSQSNGDALRNLLTIEATQWQYTDGVRNVHNISPDNWYID